MFKLAEICPSLFWKRQKVLIDEFNFQHASSRFKLALNGKAQYSKKRVYYM